MSSFTWKKLLGRLLDVVKLVDSKIPMDKESIVVGSVFGYGMYRLLKLKVSVLTIPISVMLAAGFSIYKYISYTRSPSMGYKNVENNLRMVCEELRDITSTQVRKKTVSEYEILKTIERYGGRPPEIVKMKLFSGDCVKFVNTLFVSKDINLYELALLVAYYSIDQTDTRRPHEMIVQVLNDLGRKDSNFKKKLLEYKIICCLACLLSEHRYQPEKVWKKVYKILNEVGIEKNDIPGISNFVVEGFLDKFRKVIEVFPKLEKMYLPGYNMLFEAPKNVYLQFSKNFFKSKQI